MSDFPPNWRSMKIGQFANRVKRKNSNHICDNVLTISANDGLISQKEYFNKIVASKDTSGYTLLVNGEFAYNKSYSEGFPVGAARRLRKYSDGIVSPLYICFCINQEILDLKYADYLFDSQWFISAIYCIAKEGARSHGLLNLGINEFFDASLPIPPLPEQKEIALVLSGIDRNLKLIESKINKLIQKRKSISQSFFLNKESQSCKYKKLGELADFYSGRAFKSKELSNDGIKITRISNLHKPNFPYWRFKGEYSSKIIAKKGDILFSWAGVANSINIHRYLGEDTLLNQHIYNFKFHNELIKEWTFYYVRNYLPTLRSQIEGGAGQLHLTKSDVQEIRIPILQEHLMANLVQFLKIIDQNILNYEKKLSKILTLKKGLSSDLLSGLKRVNF